MVEIWYALVAALLTAYVVLDGFDLGAGAVHLFVARAEPERRQVLGAIGPLWDGNEVWLLAAGGALFLAFPRVLASAFSGFYLAMFLVVWSLIVRGIGIELRSHVPGELWRAFWDFVFSVASGLLAFLFGVALGNVLRGVPIDDKTGYFELSLFSNFTPAPPVGLLDWYTLLMGAFALIALAAHGALFLAWKTGGELGERAARLASRLWPVVLVGAVAVFVATFRVTHLVPRAVAALPIALAVGGLGVWPVALRRGRVLTAFLGSCAFLAGSLGGVATSLFPVMLRATDGAATVDAYAAASSRHALDVGLAWYVVGLLLVIGYFVNLFRLHRGKVNAAADGEGY